MTWDESRAGLGRLIQPRRGQDIGRPGGLDWNAAGAAQQVGLGSGAGLTLGRAGQGGRREAIGLLPYATTWCKTRESGDADVL